MSNSESYDITHYRVGKLKSESDVSIKDGFNKLSLVDETVNEKFDVVIAAEAAAKLKLDFKAGSNYSVSVDTDGVHRIESQYHKNGQAATINSPC